MLPFASLSRPQHAGFLRLAICSLHLRTFHDFFTIEEAGVRNVMDHSPLAWESAAEEAQHHPAQQCPVDWHPSTTLNTHSPQHRGTVCTVVSQPGCSACISHTHDPSSQKDRGARLSPSLGICTLKLGPNAQEDVISLDRYNLGLPNNHGPMENMYSWNQFSLEYKMLGVM